MKLTYFPDTDTLDVSFDRQETGSYATYDGPDENMLVHFERGRLAGLTLEHASETAPEAWAIPAARRTAAALAAGTGQAVVHIQLDEQGRVMDAKFDHSEGPSSPHTSDLAVNAYNDLVRTRKHHAQRA